MARPLRWQRSSAANAVRNVGRQRGTKLCRSSSVHRQPNAVLTTHSSPASCPLPPGTLVSSHLAFAGEFNILPPPVVGEGRGGGAVPARRDSHPHPSLPP